MPSQFEKRQKGKATTSEVETEATPTNPGVDRDGYDVFLDVEKNKYMRVKLIYNLETGTASIGEVKEYADGQAVAQAKINELFVRKLFKIEYK